MDQSAEHVREISSALYRYHLENFLCDVFVVLPDGTEVPAHSVVLSAVSVKLRAAFEKSDNGAKKNFAFKLHVADCDLATVEVVLQFIYTGSIVLPHDTPLDITRILSAGQKLGLDAGKLAACLGAILCLTDASVMENLPPVVLTDEDICLEIVEKGTVTSASTKSGGRPAVRPSAFIRITSKESMKRTNVGYELDHSYSHQNMLNAAATDTTTQLPSEQSDLALCGSAKHGECTVVSELTGEVLTESVPDCSQMTVAADVKVEDLERSCVGISDNEVLMSFLSTNRFCSNDNPEVDSISSGHITADVGSQSVPSKRSRLPGCREQVIHICDHCGKSFARGKEYAEHRRSHTGERPFHCDVCGRGFSRLRSVAEHRRQHTGLRPFICDICAKEFYTSGELLKHRRYHSGEKLYHCSVCDRQFLRCGEFRDHRRVHAGENVCLVCGKTFTRLHNMKEHMNSAHASGSGDAKKYCCTTCGKQFAYSSGLRYHRRLHKSERPFKCQHCAKSFARLGELNRHGRGSHRDVAHSQEAELTTPCVQLAAL